MRETAEGSFIEFIGYRMPQHEQNWPSSVDDDRSRFPGKSNSLQKRFLFLISIAQWNVKEKDTTMSIVADGKGQNRGKNRKSCKMWWGARQPIDRQLFKLRFAAIVGWYLHNEKEISFQHDVWQSLVWRRLLCSKSASAWSSASISRFLKGIFFSFLDRVVPFFLLWANFLLMTTFRFWFFHEQRSFHK